MKKALLIIGIAAITAGVLSLIFALLNLYGYYHVMDGSAALYDRLHRRMILAFIIGAVLAGIGIICIIMRALPCQKV